MATIISHKKQFVFVHIRKTGGTSVSSLLGKYQEWAGLKKIYTGIERRLERRGPFSNISIFGQHFLANHASALMVRNTIGKQQFEEYFKFCIVRNPWDREVSRYYFARQRKTHKLHEMANRLDFKEFIKKRSQDEIKKGVRGYQFKKISDEQGNLIVDQIVHLEKLDEEIVPVLKKIGLDISTRIPKLNASSHRPYHSLYDSESIELVRNIAQDDIEQLGYVF